ncbi:hypothetical protein [Carboxydothermus ferrireducens]|uniref:Lipoprotein n=1 Tax=Carboxydothermus ferrireducens DSM 11255 TaxID=1119529 RepID=A0ABX2RBI8_9THEO|nr:hypothetical protein [Carboxydothermus ferrireducens]NYE57158.1 hypothetical protein [Carboxydothermus ferrireducens DSM 11255]
MTRGGGVTIRRLIVFSLAVLLLAAGGCATSKEKPGYVKSTGEPKTTKETAYQVNQNTADSTKKKKGIYHPTYRKEIPVPVYENCEIIEGKITKKDGFGYHVGSLTIPWPAAGVHIILDNGDSLKIGDNVRIRKAGNSFWVIKYSGYRERYFNSKKYGKIIEVRGKIKEVKENGIILDNGKKFFWNKDTPVDVHLFDDSIADRYFSYDPSYFKPGQVVTIEYPVRNPNEWVEIFQEF